MSVEFIGLIASIFGIIMFISPIDQIKDILENKTSRNVSPLIYLMMILNCIFWVLYGYGINSVFIIIPNSIGAILGFLTLAIIFKFR